MIGTVYKEIRQNKLLLLAALLLPLLGYCFLFLFYRVVRFDFPEDITFFEMMKPENGILMGWKVLGLLMIYYALGGITVNLFSADEKKKWSYFIAATPRGIKRQIYGKYVILVMIYGLFLISQIFTEGFMNWLGWLDTGTLLPNLTNVCIAMFFVQLLLRALEIPFLARFGVKMGTVVRLIMLVTVVLLISIWLLFSKGALELLADWTANLAEFITHLDSKTMSETLSFLISLLPCIAIPAYILSYFLSCKGYLKGVQNYDK